MSKIFRKPFANEPFTNFCLPEAGLAFQQALEKVSVKQESEYKSRYSANESETIISRNPAHPDQVVGLHGGSISEAEPAVQAANHAFRTWSKRPVAERTQFLRGVSSALRERKHEFSAWLVLEVGKNWAEADADTAEAIDFLEFYANQAYSLAESEPAIQYPDEQNELQYIPLGVGVVLPPWNFPLAILAGMTSAAIVVGNTAVVKPSPLAPTIASIFFSLLEECDLPEGVVNLIQGGADIGASRGNSTLEIFI